MAGTKRARDNANAKNLAEGLFRVRWSDRPIDLSKRIKRTLKGKGKWEGLGRVSILEPGIPLTGELLFARGGGVAHLRLYGSAVYPEEKEELDSSWSQVVGPSIERWLAELGCTRINERPARVGSLHDGDSADFIGAEEISVYVILQQVPPVVVIGFVPKAKVAPAPKSRRPGKKTRA
jgi:hypothetical protein